MFFLCCKINISILQTDFAADSFFVKVFIKGAVFLAILYLNYEPVQAREFFFCFVFGVEYPHSIPEYFISDSARVAAGAIRSYAATHHYC